MNSRIGATDDELISSCYRIDQKGEFPSFAKATVFRSNASSA
jgi:hypothetical protein